jgi:methionyl-tRNA formyltransferase
MAQSDPELEQIAQTVAKIQRDMRSAKEQNRLDFPNTAKVVDHFTATFGPVKVLWAEESGKSIGRKYE